MVGMVEIDRVDHFVLTVRDVEATCEFYETVLGMEPFTFGEDRWALRFGRQKINLHETEHPRSLVAADPRPGSADVCFVTATPMDEVVAHLARCEVDVVAGPGEREGALGPMESVYVRDPDGNLIEVSVYPADTVETSH